jgi:hypothetical protein
MIDLYAPLESITESILQDLVAEQVAEQKSLDYKREPWDLKSEGGKVEFLKDISSFANTAGGHLLVGIAEQDGKPKKILGFEPVNGQDDFKKQIEHLMQAWIKPRINVDSHFIALEDGKVALAIRVLPSTIGPHRVCKLEDGSFHARDSKGKHAMDVDELRFAFLRANTVTQQLREFCKERGELLDSDESPIPLKSGPKVIIHLIPQESITSSIEYALTSIETAASELRPFGASQYVGTTKYNLDGVLKYVGQNASYQPHQITTSLQLFRNGIVEAALADLTYTINSYAGALWNTWTDCFVLQSLPDAIKYQRAIGLRGPIWLRATLRGVGEIVFKSDHGGAFRKFDRRNFAVPEILIEEGGPDSTSIAHSLIDSIWVAAGYPRCMSIDQNHKWTHSP